MTKNLILALAVAFAGCAGGGYEVTASYQTPDMYEVQPGVYAVTGASEPTFYTNNSYWLYSSGRWYRSGRYDGGWSYAPQPAAPLVGINPYVYNARRGHRHEWREHRG